LWAVSNSVKAPKIPWRHWRYRLIGILLEAIKGDTGTWEEVMFQETLDHDLNAAAWQGQNQNRNLPPA